MANAQTDPQFQSVAERLYDFYSATPVEKIYLHQDRTNYVAGETMWFKVYQSSTEQQVESGIVYVELVNGNNDLVIESKWPLFSGITSGQIELPDTLPMGVYQVRAYTHWMKNLYPEGFFTREIHIASHYNSPLEIETDFEVEGNKLHAALRFIPIPQKKISCHLILNGEKTKSYSLEPDAEGEAVLEINLPEKTTFEGAQYFVVETGEKTRKFPVPFTPAIQLYLFPEGGNLVEGLTSKVAFKVNDRTGRGVEAQGVVVDQNGKEITKFQTTHQGNGFFHITPEAGRKYIVRLDHGTVETILPEAHADGIVMTMKRNEEYMRVTLLSRLEAQSYPLYLTIHQEGISWFNALLNQKEEVTVLDIPFDKLPSGVFTLTVYDRNDQAWCERLAFFNYPEELDIQLQADKPTYGKREKVILTMDSPTDNLDFGTYSLAVVKAGLDPAEARNNLFTDYFLQSELKGRIENPVAYLTNRDREGWQNLDLLLLTNGWRKYEWEQLMAATPEEANYPIEESLTFSGRVHLQNKKQKPEDITLNAVFRHPTIDDLQSFHPGEKGIFKFTGYDFTGTAEVILSAQDKNNNIMDLSIIEHVSSPPDFYTYGKGISKTDNESLYVEMSGRLVQHIAKDIDKTIFDLPEVAVTAKRKVKQVTRWQLHNSEFARPPLIVNKRNSYGGKLINLLYSVPGIVVQELPLGDWNIRVLGSGAMISANISRVTATPKPTNAAEDDPAPAPGGMGSVDPVVYILNGSVTSKEAIQTIPPNLVERIEVLAPATAMIYSRYASGGGIAFFTNAPMARESSPTKTLMHRFVGYNQLKTFFSPDYAMANTQGYQDADRRNTLHWQPEVSINEKGKAEVSFYTSDEKGEYLIHCEGRSSDGTIGVSRHTFMVE